MTIDMGISRPHALLLASPGMGHVIPVLELAHRLSSFLDFRVTVFVITSGGASTAESHTLRAAATRGTFGITELPLVDVKDIVEPDAAVVTKLAVTMREMRPAVRAAMLAMEVKPTVLIVDLFGTELLSLADDIGVAKKYVFFATNAWCLALLLYLPVLDKAVEGEYVEQKEQMKIPGCRPVRPDEVVDPMLDRSNQQYREFLRIGLEIPTSDGILINTLEELQGNIIAALNGDGELGRIAKVPVYPIGPIITPNEAHTRPDGLIFEWLDQQPERSVVFVCLGSGGTLSFQQTMEMAWGLELSGQRFVWVLRRPTVKSGDGSYFEAGSGDKDDVASALPEGFLDRTGGVGLVVPDWAPQAEILRHGSVGGFLSHCGWNSSLESLTSGVPMVAWPLYSEQRMNAVLLTEELGVAVRPRRFPAQGVIGREEIAELVRRIIVDDEIRDKARETKLSFERACSDDGPSYTTLLEWAKRCRPDSHAF